MQNHRRFRKNRGHFLEIGTLFWKSRRYFGNREFLQNTKILQKPRCFLKSQKNVLNFQNSVSISKKRTQFPKHVLNFQNAFSIFSGPTVILHCFSQFPKNVLNFQKSFSIYCPQFPKNILNFFFDEISIIDEILNFFSISSRFLLDFFL